MKTAGSSLRWMLLNDVFRPEEVVPNFREPDRQIVAYRINPLKFEDAFRTHPAMARARLFMGHYPLLSLRVFPKPLRTFCVFRDPVERAASHLRQIQRRYPTRSYEDLYDDPAIFDNYLYNLQARAMVFDDPKEESLFVRTFEWNDDLLERAKANLELVDVIGLAERMPEFIVALERTFGWRFRRTLRVNAAPRDQPPVSSALLSRMREDLEYDVRYYEHVVATYEERRRLELAAPPGEGTATD